MSSILGGYISFGGGGSGSGSSSGIQSINNQTGPDISIIGESGIYVRTENNTIIIGSSGVSSSCDTFAQNFTAITSGAFDHNLGTRDIIVAVYDNSGPPRQILPDNIILDTLNRASVLFNAQQTGRVVITSASCCACSGESSGGIVDPEDDLRIWYPPILEVNSIFQTGDNTAYFIYLGKRPAGEVVKFVKCILNTAGIGSTSGELGLFSSVDTPNYQNKTLTKLIATNDIDAFNVSTPVIRANTTSFDLALTVDTYLWAGIRTHMSGAEPLFIGAANDWTAGHILRIVNSPSLVGSDTFDAVTLSLQNPAGNPNAPFLFATLD